MLWDITTFIAVAVYVYTILTTISMLLMENRNPVKSIAWIVVLILVPIVGFVFYMFLGRNYRKRIIISRRSIEKSKIDKTSPVANMEYASTDHFPEKFKTIATLAYNSSDANLYKNNSLKIYTNGKQLFDDIFTDIKNAKKHIHLDYYIFNSDEIGNKMIDLLISKAKENVEIRVIIDDVGSWHMKKSAIKKMENAGIEIKEFLRVGLPFLSSKVNYRNHRKILVIDGIIGYTGGMNIADRYVHGLEWGKWRDTHVKIEGNAVHGLQRTFLSDWYFVTRNFLTDPIYYPQMQGPGECLVQVVTSGPDTIWESIMQIYFSTITQAKKYVYIQTPYFLPNDSIITALQTAALGGIDVRLILPERSDAKFALLGSYSYLDEMLKAGVKIYFFKPGFIHSKMIVVDDELMTVGSANMDFRSFEQNFEINLLVYDGNIAKSMREIFETDQQHTEQLDISVWKNRPKRQKVSESIARLFSPLL